MTNDEASMLREAWMALAYRLCDEAALFARSEKRLEADLAADGVGDPTALVWLRLMQGDIQSAVDIIQQAIQSRSDLVPFIQLVSLARYVEMVEALNFPAMESRVKSGPSLTE
jgi:hypothetical protein